MTEAQTAAPPSTPAEASARLAELRSDSAWTSALLKGGPEQTKQFHELHSLVAKGDKVDRAMAGAMQSDSIQSSEEMRMLGGAEFLRERGFPDDVVASVLRGNEATPKSFYNRVSQWKKKPCPTRTGPAVSCRAT